MATKKETLFELGAKFQRSMMQAEITELEKKIENLQFVNNLLIKNMCESCKQKLKIVKK